jgi:hypothetical protein
MPGHARAALVGELNACGRWTKSALVLDFHHGR